MRGLVAAVALAVSGLAQAQIIGTDAQVGWPAGTLPFGQLGWAAPLSLNAGWSGSLIKTTPQTLVHVGFVPGGTNYWTASSSPCWAGNIVNSPHFLFFNMACTNDATTGPDGRTADQFTKSSTTGTFYRALGATETISTTKFSSTVVGKHPTATGYVGTTATCAAPPSACTCSACTTTDGSACTASVTCTASTSTNDCRAYADINSTSWTKVSAVVTCSAPQTTVTCAGYPGRPGNDNGATAYITDVMCQDSDPTTYIHTAGTSGSSITLIGSLSGVRPIKGSNWNQIGGVRQNNPVATTPAKVGVGPFIVSYGYLEYPGNDDAMDRTSFSACGVLIPTTSDTSTTNILMHDGVSQGSNGYQMVLYETGNMSFWGYSGGVQQAAALTVGSINLVCFGVDAAGTTAYLRQNKGATASNAVTMIVDRTNPARLGVHWDFFTPFKGTLVEFWFSSEPASATVFARVAAEVESRGGITLP